MRKIKLTLQCRVPSWNFCNLDGHAALGKPNKLCRFCVSNKQGNYCMINDQWLTTSGEFVMKAPACIDATAGFAITVDEPTPDAGPRIDPKLIIRETIKNYKDTVNDLVAQGYPRQMAETIATKYVTGDK